MPNNAELAKSVIEKTFGKGNVLFMSEAASALQNPIPSGITALDRWVLGIGGVPRGQFVEMYGLNDVGKTTMLLHFMAESQEKGLVPVVLDPKAATAADTARAVRIGVDPSGVIMLPVKTSEEAIVETKEIIAELTKKNIGLVFFWDDMGLTADNEKALKKDKGGAAKLNKKGELKGDAPIGEKARIMWKFCTQLQGVCYRSGVALVIVNHLISKISSNSMFSGGQTTRGGGGIKAAARIRLKLKVIGSIKEGDRITGQIVKAETETNSFAPPRRSALLHLDFSNGYLSDESTLLCALDRELITKKGKKYKDKAWGKGSEYKLIDDWGRDQIEDLEDRLWGEAPTATVHDVDDEEELAEGDAYDEFDDDEVELDGF